MRHILLIRHAESEKNRSGSFSSASDSEPLTAEGRAASDNVARALRACLKWGSVEVHAAQSGRAQLTAEHIADTVQSDVHLHEELRSISLGNRSGATEEDLERTDPSFIADLTLYRSGLLNAYDVRTPPGAEDHYLFERRVNATIAGVVRASCAAVVVFVLHRSSLTAALIEIARRHRNYPDSFYGYVVLDLASISSVTFDDNVLFDMLVNESAAAFWQRTGTGDFGV